MALALTLLDDVRWQGAVVTGERPRALLAALAANAGRHVRDERLIELVWGDDAPANATKSLQVLVSRTRAACGADAIIRDAAGYRLGVGPAEVDAARLAALTREAVAALEVDAARAARLAREALALAEGLPAPAGENGRRTAGVAGTPGAGTPQRMAGSLGPGTPDRASPAPPRGRGVAPPTGDDPLSEVRRAAAADLVQARLVLARGDSRTGRHAEALPNLEAAHEEHPDDEPLLADLLRSEAALKGPGAALERYERYRQALIDRLGTSPGERLQRAHRDLLALDRPQREGVRYDATPLLGRDEEIAALHALLSTSRVVSIVGPGGLGKTRLAHVLARSATQPVVHVVELAGVTAAEDVVAEVGSALGVRDSISSRRTLTPAQRADVRARIAQRLDTSPALLVLDNCEHLIAAVAELVAFLVSTTADLHVLTTSRAPLAIAAERVHLLKQLDTADATDLFKQRALAARPGAHLDDEIMRRIVTRLDGLPLAIELAAARIRAMSAEEIDRRLQDRFALLRGGDRSAPDRHRTLLAVIDWSWNLLSGDEQRALGRLALFNDGFTLAAADEILEHPALDAVQGLVDQSLLSVRDTESGVRYRMLETVREFGRLQLGEDAPAALAARRRWATAFAHAHGAGLAGPDQLSAVDALAAEEVNLADELRAAIADGDNAALVELLAVLGLFWTMRGEHGWLLALAQAVGEAMEGWTPPPELEDVTRAALVMALSNAVMTISTHSEPLQALLTRLGPGSEPRLAGAVRALLSFEEDGALERLAADPDPHGALAALQWLTHVRENAGDLAEAAAVATRGLELATEDDGPWLPARLHAQSAELAMQRGERERARAHAQSALPVLERIGAHDDAVQLRSMLVLCAVAEGRLQDAEAQLEQIGTFPNEQVFGGDAVRQIGRAEIALARGDHVTGLRAYRECAATMGELKLPGIPVTGMEPWTSFGYATALTAHAHHATGEDVAAGRELFLTCRERALLVLGFAGSYLDFPATGLLLFGLGSWALLREQALEPSLRLLAIADRFGYSRSVPTMAWERIVPHAPGRLEQLCAEYLARRPPELLETARAAVTGAACSS